MTLSCSPINPSRLHNFSVIAGVCRFFFRTNENVQKSEKNISENFDKFGMNSITSGTQPRAGAEVKNTFKAKDVFLTQKFYGV
jgi:hypothetical protein